MEIQMRLGEVPSGSGQIQVSTINDQLNPDHEDLLVARQSKSQGHIMTGANAGGRKSR